MDMNDVEFKDAVIAIPKNTIELEINATVYQDGKLQVINSIYNLQEIQHLFQLFLDTIEGDYPKYVLTEKGQAYLALKELNKIVSENN